MAKIYNKRGIEVLDFKEGSIIDAAEEQDKIEKW